jgi:hypothetical protein
MIDSCFALLCVYYSKLGNSSQPEKYSTWVLHYLSVYTDSINTEKEKHKMFTAILAWFTQLGTQNYQSQLDQYIESRRPASVAEVEYLERQYSKMNRGGLI